MRCSGKRGCESTGTLLSHTLGYQAGLCAGARQRRWTFARNNCDSEHPKQSCWLCLAVS